MLGYRGLVMRSIWWAAILLVLPKKKTVTYKEVYFVAVHVFPFLTLCPLSLYSCELSCVHLARNVKQGVNRPLFTKSWQNSTLDNDTHPFLEETCGIWL